MTSRLRVRREAAPAVSLRLPSFKTSLRLEWNTKRAGDAPEINAARTQATVVKPRMRPFQTSDVLSGNPMEGTIATSEPWTQSRMRHAHTGSGGSQHQGLREDLQGHARAARAQGDADSELPLPRYRTGQQEVRHVGADDQQDDERDGQQNDQRSAQILIDTVVRLPGGQDRGADAAIGLGIGGGEAGGEGHHFGARLPGR